jgi:hypothetical protein
MDSKPFVGRIEPRAFGDHPALKRAVEFEPEVVMQTGRVLLLDQIAQLACPSLADRCAVRNVEHRIGASPWVKIPWFLWNSRIVFPAPTLNRCVVPLNSFSEFNKTEGGDIWFDLPADGPHPGISGRIGRVTSQRCWQRLPKLQRPPQSGRWSFFCSRPTRLISPQILEPRPTRSSWS